MGAMRFADDFREFLRLLDSVGAEYLVIGGYAVGIHGFPRNTGDLDIWSKPSPDNAARVEEALRQFGMPVRGGLREALVARDTVLRMGYPPFRIEIITSPAGVEFTECLARAVRVEVQGQVVPVISLDDLIRNKRAADRPKDLIDALELERIRDRRDSSQR